MAHPPVDSLSLPGERPTRSPSWVLSGSRYSVWHSSHLGSDAQSVGPGGGMHTRWEQSASRGVKMHNGRSRTGESSTNSH